MLLAGVAALIIRKLGSSSHATSFPPGPPTVPFFGTLPKMPRSKPFLNFHEWSTHYGSSSGSSSGILGFHLGPSAKMIVLSNWEQVRDLLDLKGAIYSGRPNLPIKEHILPAPYDQHAAFSTYGPRWRRQRRTIEDFLREQKVRKLLPIQQAESTQLVHDLLSHGRDCRDHLLRYPVAVILASVYGQRAKSCDAGSVCRQFYEANDEIASLLEANSQGPPYDIFPFLRMIPSFLDPWKSWKQRAQFAGDKRNNLYRNLFNETRDRLGRGKKLDCFVADVLAENEGLGDDGDKMPYTDDEIAIAASVLIEGGADTSAHVFETFSLAMAAHPEVMRLAQEEIEVLYGAEMPQSVDAKELPYLMACISETMRWRPPFPLSLPHASTAKDVYEGYVIPKDTVVLMNVWAIQHDPAVFDDPDNFEPARFMRTHDGSKYEAQQQQKDGFRRDTYVFGSGRRVCPGRKVAEESLLILAAKVLWAFDIVPTGKVDTDIRTGFKESLLIGPKDLPFEFAVRSEEKRVIIEKEWEKADGYLSRFE